MFQRLQQQGYRGSYATVARYAQRLWQAQGLAPRQPPPATSPLPLVAEPQHGHLTPRGTAWLVLRRPETRTPDEEQQLVMLTAQHAELAEAVTLARDFAALVRTRQPERLDGWLARTTASVGSALQRFAQGLRDDYAAVKVGVTVPNRATTSFTLVGTSADFKQLPQSLKRKSVGLRTAGRSVGLLPLTAILPPTSRDLLLPCRHRMGLSG